MFVKGVVRRFDAAFFISSTRDLRSGLSQTGPAGCQLRVLPDQRCAIIARVARTRRDEADRAVEVFVVVPVRERFHPRLRIGLRGKTLVRPIWAILAGAKLRLGEWVVVADAQATVGRQDA